VIGELPAALYDEAVALWHAVGLTRPWNDPMTDLLRAMAGPASTVLAAGALDGTVMVGTDGHRAWMYYLAVDPAQQGRGLGRALVAAAEQWAKAQGAPKLMLMVRTSNTAVTAFYEALGYEANEVATMGKLLQSGPGD
jgi:ribosomal protein S18 acetylase RimI-like enzyme